jgi:hypothetical protein
VFSAGGFVGLCAVALALVAVATRNLEASIFTFWHCRQGVNDHGGETAASGACGVELSGELGGTWYWLRSPDEEKRVVMGLFNQYCIRCHGQDGRGIWDIPGIPDFTNVRWQASRSDGQLARIILEGRGAVMPPFRGALSLEEAWAMARYLRTFRPGTETPRPDVGTGGRPAPKAP